MILAFHDINKNFLSIEPLRFEYMIKVLKKNNFTFLSSEEFFSSINSNKRRNILLTFDDGYMGLYKYGLKIFKKYNLKGIIFVVSKHVGKNAHWDKHLGIEKKLMGWEELKEFIRVGFEIGSHTLNHRELTSLSKNELYHELFESKKIIEKILNINVDKIAYPYYRTDWRVKTFSFLAGYRKGFGGIFGNGTMELRRLPVYPQTSIKEIVFFAKKEVPSLKTRVANIASRANLFTARFKCFT